MNEFYCGLADINNAEGDRACAATCEAVMPVMVYVRLADRANVDRIQFKPLDGACSLSPRARVRHRDFDSLTSVRVGKT